MVGKNFGTAFVNYYFIDVSEEDKIMRKYSKSVQKDVEREIKEMNVGTLKSGRNGKKVHSRKQAIAIALSEARRAGKKVPDNPNQKK